MNVLQKMKLYIVLLCLSSAFTACEKDILESESANEVGLQTRLQTSVLADPFELRINSGGNETVYGDETFVADIYFTGNGKTYGNGSIADIAGTERDEIYKSERSSQTTFGYSIPLENGSYSIKLHFAEIYWGATGGGQGAEGKRIFSVDMEGNTILSDYDINQDVGAMTAVIKSYDLVISDGELNLGFSSSVDQPKIAAIEIIGEEQVEEPIEPVDPSDAEVLLRINSGGGEVSFGDIVFDADEYFVGGSTHNNDTSQENIAETELDFIYRTERNSRDGDFGYEIPVESGHNYTVKLHFAEIYHGADGGDPTGGDAGKRVFNVELEGVDNIGRIDLNEQPGTMTALVPTMTTDVTDGILNIDFIAEVDQAKISAIEVFSLTGALLKRPCEWREDDLADSNHNHIEGQVARVNGKLYMFGGFEPEDGSINDYNAALVFKNNTEIYDPIADSWSDGAGMPVAVSHGGMQVVGTDVLIIGGFVGDNGGPTTTLVQVYNTLNDTWKTNEQLSLDPNSEYRNIALPFRMGSVAAVLDGRRIHIFGGYGVERTTNLDQHHYYDLDNPDAGWQERASLSIARGHHGGIALNGTIYAMGGQIGHDGSVNPDSSQSNNTNNVEAYNFADDTWSPKAPLLRMHDPVGNSHFELSLLAHNGKIMIAGGNNGARGIHQYDPIQNEWSEYCNLPDAMLTPTMMVSGDKLIITGGGIGGNWNPTKKTRWIPAPN